MIENLEQKVKEYKKKHDDVFLYEADDKQCLLRKPDRKILSAAAAVGKNDNIKYNEVLINNCWLEGDDELRRSDAYFFGLSQHLDKIVEVKQGELKKL